MHPATPNKFSGNTLSLKVSLYVILLYLLTKRLYFSALNVKNQNDVSYRNFDNELIKKFLEKRKSYINFE